MTSSGVILILNGPNLNLLGSREPAVYGTATLADIEALCAGTAAELGFSARCVQSNHEGVLLDEIQAAQQGAVGIVINAGAFSHTSVALRDALSAVKLPAVEVHLSNVHAREEFRHHSYLSSVVDAVIVGAGVNGYRLAITQLATAISP